MDADPRTDAELLRQYRDAGDRQALSLLFERHRLLAYRVARSVLGDAADAEDATQDAFLNLLAYEPRVRPDGPLTGLVARMALRAAQRLARGTGRRRAREDTWAMDAAVTAPDPLEEVAERDARRALRSAVDALRDPYRLPVVLHYWNGLSTQETAQALGISHSAAKTRLHRAVGHLRRQMERHGSTLAPAALLALLHEEPAHAEPPSLAPRLEHLAADAPLPLSAVGTGAGAAAVAVKAKLLAAAAVVAVSLGGIGALHRLPPPPGARAERPAASAPSSADGRLVSAAGAPPTPAVQPAPTGRLALRPEPAPSRPSVPVEAGAGAGARPATPAAPRSQGPAAPAAVPLDSDAPPSDAPPADSGTVLREAIAALRAREAAITTIRGFVVSDFRKSEAAWARLRRALEADGQKDITLWEKPRTLCVAQFTAGQDLYRMDGLMLNEGAGSPWGLAPPESSAARAGKAPPWRTVVIRDGERETTSPEGSIRPFIRPMRNRGPAIAQVPLARFLLCDQMGKGLSFQFSGGLAALVGLKLQWDYVGDEEIGKVRCARIRGTFRHPGPNRPSGTVTYWLARSMGFAPMRCESVTWHEHPGYSEAFGQLWAAEDYHEVPPGVWLPGRVRVENALATKGGPEGSSVQWEEIHVSEFLRLEVNQPLTREEVLEREGLTLGSEEGGATAWKRAEELLRKPPPLEQQRDPRFLALMQECASGGTAAAPAANP